MNTTRRILACLGVALATTAAATAQNPDLLTLVDGQDPQFGVRQTIRRSQVARLEVGTLLQTNEGDQLRMQLFDNTSFTIEIQSVTANALGGRTWKAQVAGKRQSLLTISEVGGEFVGSAVLATSRFPRPIQIDPIGNGLHAVRELKYTQSGDDSVELNDAGPEPDTTSGCDEVIRILMVYGNGALNEAGGINQISAWMANQVAYLNQVMINSLIPTRFEISSVRHLNTTSTSSMNGDLQRLQLQGDGFYDEVHNWRDQTNSDLVAWIVGNHPSHRTILGLAYRPESMSQLTPSRGFSIAEYDQGDHVFTHEIMHNLGCHHDPANMNYFDDLIRPFARGKRENQGSGVLITRFCTAVGYPTSSFPVIPYLSSPRITYRNSYGVFGNGPSLALGSATQDNALVAGDASIYRAVANYRVTNPTASITSEPQDVVRCSGYRYGAVVLQVGAANATNYQWFKDGVEIPGETGPTLDLVQNQSSSLVGGYHCEVWNGCGRSNSVTSRTAIYSLDPNCNNVRYQGVGVSSDYGRSIANIGDFNGDGFDDLAIGAPSSVGNSGYTEVRSGADGSSLFAHQGAPGSRLGQSVAAAGDVDGDGFDDYIVGAPSHDNDRGRVLVVFGSANSLGLSTAIDGPNPLSGFGQNVGRGGDINGDGVPDFLIEAPGDSRMLIYSGATNARLYTRNLTTGGGVVASTVGDIDRDGYDDFLIGERDFGSLAGRVTIVSGRTGALLMDKRGVGSERLGWSVAGLGDIDGDEVPDYIVGSPDYHAGGLADAGRAQIFSGRTHALIRQHTGTVALGQLGYSVAATGSDPARGDAPNYVIGAPGERSNGGNVKRHAGSDGLLLQSWNGQVGVRLGTSVAAVRDTGNPESNLAAGMPNEGPSGSVLVAQRGSSNVSPSTMRFLGTSCPSSSGVRARLSYEGRSAVGLAIDLGVFAAPPTAPVSLSLDVVDSNLPLDLIGAPGCVAHALPILAVGTATSPLGRATLTLPIPNQAGLVGIPLLAQFAIVEPGVNVLGITTTEAASMLIGAR